MRCDEKVKYETENHAIKTVLHGLKRTKVLRHYKCPECGKWHITHLKKAVDRPC